MNYKWIWVQTVHSNSITENKFLGNSQAVFSWWYKTNFLWIVIDFYLVYKMSQSERHTLTPRDLRCYDDMVIVTHEVSWLTDNNCGNTNALKIIQDLCDGRNSCYVNHSKALLGGDGCSYMYYSCQTGKMYVIDMRTGTVWNKLFLAV